MLKRHGNLFVISGPSGAGQGTLVSRLMAVVDDAWLSVSATTRAPREGETDGIQYYFVSTDEFRRMIDEGELLEWACFSGNYYGTPRASVEKHIAAGEQVILEIEIQGARQVKKQFPEAHLVFIEPPSLEVLEQRLRGRGTESEDAIRARLETARVELAGIGEYDFRLVNDDLDLASAQLIAYIERHARNLPQRAAETADKEDE